MEYIIHLAILVSIFSILGLGLNLILGYTGLISVMHASFYGIGAYSTALVLRNFIGINFFAALLVGLLVAGAGGFVMGWALSRLSGDYYAMGTIAFNEILYYVVLNYEKLTRGSLGIPGIARPNLFGIDFYDNFIYLVLCLVALLLIYLLCQFLVKSAFGRTLKAIREDEKALQVFGYKTHYFKLLVFAIGAMLAAVAGALYAGYISYIDPSLLGINQAVFILSIVIMGGLASLRGSVLGALILVLLPELLRFLGFPDEIAAQLRVAIYGLVLVLLMMYRSQGIIGEYKL